ncbi:MAG: alkaline phosphatase family protein [Arachnia sp.]
MTGPSFVEPRYGGLGLNNLLPSVAARLTGETPAIALPAARRYVVLLVDGLGWHQLADYADHAETMAAHLARAERLTCGVPSTTAASLTSLGCGLPPGEHGVVGYSFREPSVDRVLNALTWEGGPDDVMGFAQARTVFERLGAVGVPSAAVTLGRFASSALTRLAFAGTTLVPVTEEGGIEHVGALVDEALAHSRVVYCYERMLDHTGHGFGVGSWQWLERLGQVDDLVARLEETLPDDACLLVTGDHGMINVPAESRVTVEDESRLGGHTALGGEPRFRHVYGDDPRALGWAWSSVLGERALVLRREEAIEAGWFGPLVTDLSAARLGDVVAAMTEDFAVMTNRTPREFGLVGMHGSLTPAEMEVPLLVVGGA